jgi:hypothetical protein
MPESPGASRPFSNSIFCFYSQAHGAIPNGARVEKIHSEPGDEHQDGDRGAVIGSIGPILHLVTGEMAYGYWIGWDDRPELPVFIVGDRIQETP